jgi:hypothetical protein
MACDTPAGRRFRRRTEVRQEGWMNFQPLRDPGSAGCWRSANSKRGHTLQVTVQHGTAPNFYLTHDRFFLEQKDRIKRSIAALCPWHQKVGYDEMTDHAFMTKDRMVHRTRFSSGWSVIVNYHTSKPYRAADGVTVKPLDWHQYRETE